MMTQLAKRLPEAWRLLRILNPKHIAAVSALSFITFLIIIGSETSVFFSQWNEKVSTHFENQKRIEKEVNSSIIFLSTLINQETIILNRSDMSSIPKEQQDKFSSFIKENIEDKKEDINEHKKQLKHQTARLELIKKEYSSTFYEYLALHKIEFFRRFIIVLMVIHALLWIVMAPGFITFSLAQEFNIGTWVFQQTAPQSAFRFLLGKLVGVPGDVYIASAVSVPFLIFSVLNCDITFVDLIKCFLLLLTASFFLSSLYVYLSSLSDRQFNSHLVTMGIMPLAITFLYLSSGSFYSGLFHANSSLIAAMNPLIIITDILYKNVSTEFGIFTYKDHITDFPVYFYSFKLPIILFVTGFYTVCGLCFFTGAAGRLRRKMGNPMSRIPTVIFFLIIELILIGFSYIGICDKHETRYQMFESTEYIKAACILLNIALLYLFCVFHSFPLGLIRPWLYRLERKRISISNIFTDSAPMIFTFLINLFIVCAGTDLLCYLIKDESLDFISVVALPSVLLRDALLLQGLRIYSKNGFKIAALAYSFAFIAPTILINVFHRGGTTIIFDLTPYTALAMAIDNAKDRSREISSTLMIIYPIINFTLAIVFAYINIILLSRAREGLRKDFACAFESP